MLLAAADVRRERPPTLCASSLPVPAGPIVLGAAHMDGHPLPMSDDAWEKLRLQTVKYRISTSKMSEYARTDEHSAAVYSCFLWLYLDWLSLPT